ncbi:MAG TPA: DNA repair protein RecN [Ignavibacteriaceae bacterium]|nr:DNA repair protein RecN [Ignavibacteriaceae bacterium]
MLKSLQVKDYALIENISVEFGKGLNIITGETGAGKSILIDAMSLLLGERAAVEVVRKGASKSIVEGIFETDFNSKVPFTQKVQSVLEENEIELLPELIIRREISLKGNNRCFVNDTPVSLNVIKELGNLLVDLHGQHDHQSLLRTETHIDYLDIFSGTEALLIEYRNCYKDLESLKKEIQQLRNNESLLKEKQEIYLFQIKEIDSVSPEEGEEEKLTEELKILENSEKLLEITDSIYLRLYDSEDSVFDALNKIKKGIEELTAIDKTFIESHNECETALALLNDISGSIRNYKSRIDLEPEHIEKIRGRIGSLNLLKKRYGGTIKAVIEHRKKIGEEADLAENFSGRISQLENNIKDMRIKCGEYAEKISRKRIESSKKIQKDVQSVLHELGISNSRFLVKIDQHEEEGSSDNYILINGKPFKYNYHGYDEVEFLISMNIGEDLKPLAKVASGGEISRIMLSLKSSLAKNDRLPLLIFDEIDTGVSGRIAQKVGQALKSLAQFHQIIAITHLPQIAGLAEHHYAVEKKVVENRTNTSLKKLKNDERIREIAKLMSGEKITDSSLKGAKELMGI